MLLTTEPCLQPLQGQLYGGMWHCLCLCAWLLAIVEMWPNQMNNNLMNRVSAFTYKILLHPYTPTNLDSCEQRFILLGHLGCEPEDALMSWLWVCCFSALPFSPTHCTSLYDTLGLAIWGQRGYSLAIKCRCCWINSLVQRYCTRVRSRGKGRNTLGKQGVR